MVSEKISTATSILAAFAEHHFGASPTTQPIQFIDPPAAADIGDRLDVKYQGIHGYGDAMLPRPRLLLHPVAAGTDIPPAARGIGDPAPGKGVPYLGFPFRMSIGLCQFTV